MSINYPFFLFFYIFFIFIYSPQVGGFRLAINLGDNIDTNWGGYRKVNTI
jgi:hypothetical protein